MRPPLFLAALLAFSVFPAAAQAPCGGPEAIQSGRYADVTAGLEGEALPNRPFRVYLRGGMAEYRPGPMNDTNLARRRLMLAMINGVSGTSAPLHPLLRSLMNATITNRRERGAYILSDGTLGPVITGEPGTVDVGDNIPAHTVGLVHTHPTPCELLAPPSANDYSVLPFDRYPIQLVIECNRVWGVLAPQHATYLGSLMPGDGGFQGLRDGDPTATRAYAIVDGDTVRLNAHSDEECRARERSARQAAAMRELAEQRAAEARRRREGAAPSPAP